MRKIYTIIAFLCVSLSVSATPQVADILIWNGDTLRLFSNPLEARDDYSSLIDKIWDELDKQYTLLYPNSLDDDRYFVSSMCWRGYCAEWIILNDSLFLNNIYHCSDRNVKVDIAKVFSEISTNEKLFASWVNEDLIIPKGECLEYIHLGYESIYEQETILQFENGKLKNIKSYQNEVVKRSYFSGLNPSERLNFIYSNISWDILPDLKDKHIQVQVIIQPNKQGRLEYIDEDYTYLIDYSNKDTVLNVVSYDENNLFIKEGVRIARMIPDWDVIYQRGKIKKEGLMIFFYEEYKNKYTSDKQ